MATSGWPAGYNRPMKPVRYKFLSSINLGGNEIRFLGVNEKNQAVHFPSTVRNCPGRLLFLASDVLSGTSIARKNHIRVHGRYAKNGFATKLRLTGFKIEGINNSGIMWFYSIQGLFHVTFELHDIATQRDCLTKLQDLWLSRYNDPPLKPEGTVRFNLRLRIQSESNTEEGPSISSEPEVQLFTTGGLGSGTEPKPLVVNCCPSKIVVIDEVDRMLQAASYLDQAVEINDEEEDNSETLTDTSDIQDRVEEERGDVDPSRDSRQELGAGDFVEQLISFVRSSITNVSDISHQIIMQILMTLDYLKHLSSQKDEHFLEWGCVFFNMMEEYLVLIRHDTTDDSFDNTFGIPREKYILLYVISDWLGKEFHKLESQVSQKVEIFKKRNIDSLDNLPPSETTIDMLFPICMKKLMVNWLGGPMDDASSLDWLSSVAFSDHSYIPAPKARRKGNAGHPNYALIQLILEFTSNCLISGMAHVVFSRLQLEAQTQ